MEAPFLAAPEPKKCRHRVEMMKLMQTKHYFTHTTTHSIYRPDLKRKKELLVHTYSYLIWRLQGIVGVWDVRVNIKLFCSCFQAAIPFLLDTFEVSVIWPHLLYLSSSFFVQLHRHQRWCPLLADGRVSTLPEEVAALLLPRPGAPHLRVLPTTNWDTQTEHYMKTFFCIVSSVKTIIFLLPVFVARSLFFHSWQLMFYSLVFSNKDYI